jgi:trigger factor
MKVEKNEKEPCVFELSMSAGPEEIKDEYKKVFNVFMKNGVIPGFRKGHVPADLIKRRFESDIKQEAITACFRKFYPGAVQESGLKVLQLHGVTTASIDPATGFECTAIVEVEPTFDLPKYKKLSVKRNEVKVTDEQVAERVEAYRAAYAKYEEAKEDAVVGDGDFVNFDYKGTLNGQPLSEIVPDEKAVCGAEGFWVQIEEGRFLPEILEALKGMKAGEEKKGVAVKFPEEGMPDQIKGKTAEYDLALKSFRCRVLPDDKAFVEAAKAESLEALQKQIREEMEKAADAAELENRRNQVVEQLLKKADFDVPPSLVSQGAERALREFAQNAQHSGLPADYFEKNRDAIVADAQNAAIRRLRVSYILTKIAEEEKIEVTDEDVEKELEKMAENSGVEIERMRKEMENPDHREGFKDHIRIEKTFDFILSEAK